MSDTGLSLWCVPGTSSDLNAIGTRPQSQARFGCSVPKPSRYCHAAPTRCTIIHTTNAPRRVTIFSWS